MLNNSNDNSYEIAKSFSNSEIQVFKQNEIQGSYATRAYGVKKSSGNYFLFIDADVIFSSNALDSIFKLILKNEVKYAGFNVKMKLCSNSLSSKMNFIKGFNVKRCIEKDRYTPTCALLVEKKVYINCGGFDESLESSGDYIFGLTVSQLKINQLYIENIEFYHPTRITYQSLISKSNRIARGHVQLYFKDKENYGNLYAGHFKLKNFIPKNPFTYKKIFKIYGFDFGLKEFLFTPFFYIPISFIRLFHAYNYFKKINQND